MGFHLLSFFGMNDLIDLPGFKISYCYLQILFMPAIMQTDIFNTILYLLLNNDLENYKQQLTIAIIK